MTDPNPTDRGKPGTKRHLVVDARGTPLGVVLTGANRHESTQVDATLDAIPPVRSGGRGRPRRRPDKLHADKAYDHRRCRRECRARGITPRIARHGIESNQRPGRQKWVFERTLARFARFRRSPSPPGDAPTSTPPSRHLPAPSSPSTSPDGSVRCSYSNLLCASQIVYHTAQSRTEPDFWSRYDVS